MPRFATHLAAVCNLLNQEGAEYLVVGARAIQLWGSTRTTRDIEILVAPTVENASRILRALEPLGSVVAREWLAREIAARKVTVIGERPRVDILTEAWNLAYDQAALAATHFVVEGVAIPTASLDAVIMSRQTGRPQDTADIEVLEEIQRIKGL